MIHIRQRLIWWLCADSFFFFFWSGALSRFTTRKKGLRDEIFQIRRLSNNLRDEIIFRLLSEHL